MSEPTSEVPKPNPEQESKQSLLDEVKQLDAKMRKIYSPFFSDKLDTPIYPNWAAKTVDLLEMVPGKEETEREAMSRKIFEIVNELLPSDEELQRDKPEELREFLTQQDVLQNARRADFLLDKEVVQLLNAVDRPVFDDLMTKARNGELPACLTSDKEMKRLSEVYRPPSFPVFAFEKRGIPTNDESARKKFLSLCQEEEPYSIDPKGNYIYNYQKHPNIGSAFETLNAEFPQG